MERVYNFSPGPSALPVEVLEQAQKEMLCYGSSGLSVMEMSHRGKYFMEIHAAAIQGLRDLMHIPENYKVLFVQGGATMQFAMAPMNLMKTGKADYVVSGSFSGKAAKEAERFGAVNVVASSKATNFNQLPEIDPVKRDSNADYFHICTNNTIYGTAFHTLPEVGAVPLVADMSSNILGQVYDINKFGVIYAGAQKNIGPAGLTVVVVREDLIRELPTEVPNMMRYKTYADEDSMHNTPPTYAIYIAGLVFEWLKKQGGVAGIEKINREKAALLYDAIDNSNMYTGTAVAKDRSIMNVTFTLPSEELTADFIKQATAAGLTTLKGHRSVGGIRASIYNAVPVEGVKALVAFMQKFEIDNK